MTELDRTSWLFPVVLFVVGALLSGVSQRLRWPRVAPAIAASCAAAGAAWLIWLASNASAPALAVSWPLAVLVGLVAISQALARLLAPHGTGSLSLALLAAGAVVGSLIAVEPFVAYVFGTAALGAGWLANLRASGEHPAAWRDATTYAIACALADLTIPLGPTLAVHRPELAALLLLCPAAVRLGLVPAHVALVDSARGFGSARLSLQLYGAVVGLGYLLRAASSAWAVDPMRAAVIAQSALVPVGVLTCVAGVLLLATTLDERRALARIWLIDSGHVAVAIGIGSPAAIAAAVVYATNAFLARATLHLVQEVNATRDDAQQRAGILLPRVLGLASLMGAPPLTGFVARWLLYYAAFEAGFGFVALSLAAVTILATTLLLFRVKAARSRRIDWLGDRALLAALAPILIPLCAVAAGPYLVVAYLGAPIIESLRPGVAWTLGVEQLLGIAGVAGLVLSAIILPAAAFLYLRSVERRTWAWPRTPAGVRLRRVVTAGTALAAARSHWRLLAETIEVIGLGTAQLVRLGTGRYLTATLIACACILLLVAHG